MNHRLLLQTGNVIDAGPPGGGGIGGPPGGGVGFGTQLPVFGSLKYPVGHGLFSGQYTVLFSIIHPVTNAAALQ